MRNLLIFCTLVFIASTSLTGCWSSSEDLEGAPRPMGFHRLELPEHQYQKFACDACPMAFEYPTYGTLFVMPEDSCVLNIDFPELACKWHITYEELDSIKYPERQAFEKYRSMIYRHSQKGRVYESQIDAPAGYGTLFEIYGEVPTSAQFYITNGEDLAVENSFYFATAMRNDSLKPVIKHIKADLMHMIESLEWNEDYTKTMPGKTVDCGNSSSGEWHPWKPSDKAIKE